MSSNDTYTPHPNSARWPFYAMTLFAIVCCILMWRGCQFSGTDPGTPAATTEAVQ